MGCRALVPPARDLAFAAVPGADVGGGPIAVGGVARRAYLEIRLRV